MGVPGTDGLSPVRPITAISAPTLSRRSVVRTDGRAWSACPPIRRQVAVRGACPVSDACTRDDVRMKLMHGSSCSTRRIWPLRAPSGPACSTARCAPTTPGTASSTPTGSGAADGGRGRLLHRHPHPGEPHHQGSRAWPSACSTSTCGAASRTAATGPDAAHADEMVTRGHPSHRPPPQVLTRSAAGTGAGSMGPGR
jgi:hypothetical protein